VDEPLVSATPESEPLNGEISEGAPDAEALGADSRGSTSVIDGSAGSDLGSG
jgi:hypothetical protein